MRIGLCTGGGDCPGLNAVIRSFVKSCHRKNIKVIGIQDSFKGLKEKPPLAVPLTIPDVTDIYFKGGTILGTYSVRGKFKESFEESIELIKEGYDKLKLDGLVAVGGEGTQMVAKALSVRGLNVLGIPKTIDNDIPGCERTVGFSTCVDLVSESVFRLQSTAESHDRVMILEVMGRDSGYIGLYGGLAGGAHVILIPEIPFSYDKICQKILERKKLGRNYSVIVVSEGAKSSENSETKDSSALSIGQVLAKKISEKIDMEARVTVLGHLQRGGTPNSSDRLLATKLGVRSVDLVEQKVFGKVLVVQKGRIIAIDYDQIKSGERKPVDLSDFTLTAAESIGICLGR